MTDAEIRSLLAILSIAPAAIARAWWRVARRQVRRKGSPLARLIDSSRISHFEVGAQIDDIVSQIGFKAFVDLILADESRSSFGPLLQALDLDGQKREFAVRGLSLLLPHVTQIDVGILRPPERSALHNILTLHYIGGNRHDSGLIVAVINVMVRLRDTRVIVNLQQIAEMEPIDPYVERVRAAANDAVTRLLAIKQLKEASDSLLRPTLPQVNPLLRPADTADSGEQHMLLRAPVGANDSEGSN